MFLILAKISKFEQNENLINLTDKAKYLTSTISTFKFQNENSDNQIFSNANTSRIATSTLNLTKKIIISYKNTSYLTKNHNQKIKNVSQLFKNNQDLIDFQKTNEDKAEHLNISENKYILNDLFMSIKKSTTFSTVQPTSTNFITEIQIISKNKLSKKVRCQMKTSLNDQIEGIENDLINLPCSNIYSLNYMGNITYKCKEDGKFHVFNSSCRNSEVSLLDQLKFEVKY
jgi:hypothetical protein